MKNYKSTNKKAILCIAMIIFVVSLVLCGCSVNKKANSNVAVASNAVTNQEVTEPTIAAEPTLAAEVTPEPTPEASAVPEATGWTTVVDQKIDHATNICGFLNEKFGITVGFQGEIHYTEDGGQTWPESQNSSMCRFSVDIVDENLIWSGGNGGNVRVSKDGGENWSAVSDIQLKGMHSGIDFVDDTTGWIIAKKKLAATKDGGQTWTELTVPEEAVGIAAVCLRTPNDGYLLSNNGYFFTTKDGGTTWNKYDLNFVQYGITDPKGVPVLPVNNVAQADISFTDENNGIMFFTGIAIGEGAKTWCLTTSDGGGTWKSELFPKMEGFSPTKVFLSNDGKYLTLGTADNHTIVFKHD